MSELSAVSEPSALVEPSKRARTRERLMDAAAGVFSETGFGAASLELICERAGLTRGAFYYNFSSKEELFLAAMGRELDSVLGFLAESAGPDSEGLDQVIAHLRTLYATDAYDYVALVRLNEEFRLYALRDDAAAAAYTEHFRTIHERLGSAFSSAAALDGRVMLAAPETVAAIAIAIFFQTVNEGVLARQDESEIFTVAAERASIALEALMPRAPRS